VNDLFSPVQPQVEANFAKTVVEWSKCEAIKLSSASKMRENKATLMEKEC